MIFREKDIVYNTKSAIIRGFKNAENKFLEKVQAQKDFKSEMYDKYLILELGSGQYVFTSEGVRKLLPDVEAP